MKAISDRAHTAALCFPLTCARCITTFQYYRASCANCDAFLSNHARDLTTRQVLPEFSTIACSDGFSTWFHHYAGTINICVAYSMSHEITYIIVASYNNKKLKYRFLRSRTFPMGQRFHQLT